MLHCTHNLTQIATILLILALVFIAFWILKPLLNKNDNGGKDPKQAKRFRIYAILGFVFIICLAVKAIRMNLKFCDRTVTINAEELNDVHYDEDIIRATYKSNEIRIKDAHVVTKSLIESMGNDISNITIACHATNDDTMYYAVKCETKKEK